MNLSQAILAILVLSIVHTIDAYAVYPDDGYCCAPNNPFYNQCSEIVTRTQCDGMGGTLSEWKNTGACTDCKQRTVGYCCAPNASDLNQCRDLISQDRCDALGGTLSEFKNTGACADCQTTQPTVSCCFPSGGGYGCEQWTQRECTAREGDAYNSCNDCWARYEQEQEAATPKVSCCFPANDGVGCEQWTQRECDSRNGRALNSCSQCWNEYRQQQNNQRLPPSNIQNLPPAGYEDEVLVNFDAYYNPFPDTSLSTLEGKASAELYRRAVIGGFPDGQFKGDRPVNRAEAAKFLLLARFGKVSDVSNNGRFPDVLDGQWYAPYVVTAANKGIINGHPDGRFKPANGVNTAEFLKMLTLTFGLPQNLPHGYRDVSLTDWFDPYAGIAKHYNLFPQRTSYLSPSTALTRNEVAVAMYQYLEAR